MKLINYNDKRYYPEGDDVKRILYACKVKKVISMYDLAAELGYSYAHLWRKLNKYKFPKNAFSEMEVLKIEKLCEIKFHVH